jgi:hypothetical protein
MFQEYFAKRVVELLQNQKKYEVKEREFEIISRLGEALGKETGYDLQIITCAHENCSTAFVLNMPGAYCRPRADMCNQCGAYYCDEHILICHLCENNDYNPDIYWHRRNNTYCEDCIVEECSFCEKIICDNHFSLCEMCDDEDCKYYCDAEPCKNQLKECEECELHLCQNHIIIHCDCYSES